MNLFITFKVTILECREPVSEGSVIESLFLPRISRFLSSFEADPSRQETLGPVVVSEYLLLSVTRNKLLEIEFPRKLEKLCHTQFRVSICIHILDDCERYVAS